MGQSTLISYHTEAFVKTESACTVVQNLVGEHVSKTHLVKKSHQIQAIEKFCVIYSAFDSHCCNTNIMIHIEDNMF